MGAGEIWNDFVLWSIENNLSGIENLALIPGLVGASPMQNIGAYGMEVKDVIKSVDYVEINSGNKKTMENSACNFGYRDSIFKHELKGKVVITKVIFKLSKTPLNKTTYGAISDELKSLKKEASPKNIAEAVINIRSRKLPNPAEIPNAGSFFTNPIIKKTLADRLLDKFPEMPVYPVASPLNNDLDCEVKVAAGWLIDQCGWKGKSLGLAKMHDLQALVLTLQKGASQQDLLAIQQAVQVDVMSKFGIQLHPEPQPFG